MDRKGGSRVRARRGTARAPLAGLLLAALVLSAGAAPAGESSLVTELRGFHTRYHEDPPRLAALREGLEQAVAADPSVGNLLALAQVSFIWGDIRAETREAKLTAYNRGREAARRAVSLEPQNLTARLWYATNTARWGQAKGVLRSLFLLPGIQEEIGIIMELAPAFAPVYALAGNVFYEVPRLLGGDLEKAEAAFRRGLALDPHFTTMRVGLARTLLKRGRAAEARQELLAVLTEQAPRNRADWTLTDAREARALLESLRDGS